MPFKMGVADVFGQKLVMPMLPVSFGCNWIFFAELIKNPIECRLNTICENLGKKKGTVN
jgi:hypothetical protein